MDPNGVTNYTENPAGAINQPAQPAAAPTAANVTTFEFPLKSASANGLKWKRNVARFPPGTTLDFQKWPQPVKMNFEIIRGGKREELPAVPIVNTDKPKAIRRRQLERFYNKKKEAALGKFKVERVWNLEDAEGEHAFEGIVEGGQASSYALFMMEGSEFVVYPIEEWYNFKSKKNFKILSLEEAEATLDKRNHLIDRWFLTKLNKPSGADAEIKTTKEEEAADDVYDNEEEFSILGRLEKSSRKTKVKKEDEDVLDNRPDDEDEDDRVEKEEKEEEPDFGENEVRFSDDEEEDVPEDTADQEDKNLPDTDNPEDTRLSEAGKEMKTLLKNRHKEEEEFGSSEESEEDSAESADDDDGPVTRPKKEGINVKQEPGYSGTSTVTTSTMDSDRKRGSSSSKDGAPKKKVKQEPTEVGASTTITPAPTGPVDEEEVRKALLLGGKMKTKQLVNRFKSRLTDQQQKARFLQMVKKLGRFIEEFGEKYLVLKDEYRGGLKIPK